jgi:nucleolar GTP-binding protein
VIVVNQLLAEICPRPEIVLRNATQKIVVDKLKMNYQKVPNLMAKRGEADRDIQTKMPKHLVAGKRKIGKDNHR